MTGKMSRDKGARLEREVANRAIAVGLDAVRSAPMQGLGRSAGADVTINGSILVECKSRARISGWTAIITSILLNTECPLTKEQQAWVESHHALVLKQTGWPEPVVVAAAEGGYMAMTLTAWLALLTEAKQ